MELVGFQQLMESLALKKKRPSGASMKRFKLEGGKEELNSTAAIICAANGYA